MPADNELDPLDRWLNQQVQPLPPPPGTFELITKRARHRKIRKAVLSVASAAVVAAAIGVAVPLSTTLHLTTTSAGTNVSAEGSVTPAPAGSQSVPGHTAQEPDSAAASSQAGPGAASAGASRSYLPPNYVPSSVTWDSTSTGWVMGPAGTPGRCANKNPDICTSVARTDDGGQTWQGLPAPDTGGPETSTGVTGLRFLNASYGWAFGPELWATDNGAENWHKVDTGGSAVTDLETTDGRAYALFGDCDATGDTIAECTSYTLKTARAGSGTWAPVAGVPSGLSLGTGQRGSAVIELNGAAGKEPATGYLVAPDGTLYAGPLDGTAWHEVVKLPCTPGTANSDGLPSGLMLTADGTTAAGTTRLALVCSQVATGDTSLYLSTDNGTTWAQQTNVKSTPATSVPQSLTALPDGTLILAAIPGGGQSGGGIYLLSPGATQWRAATLSDPSGKTFGFSYVGMTSATQGVALGGDPDLNAIWMTADGGVTWQVRQIKS
jgi:hypothetical protein